MSDPNHTIPLRPFGEVNFSGYCLNIRLHPIPPSAHGRRDWADMQEAITALRDWCESTYPQCKRQEANR